MSKNFKSWPQQVADKLAADFNAGTSIFQKLEKTDGTAEFLLPYNPTTGKNYKGIIALVLAMQHREDPRWMSEKQAKELDWSKAEDQKPTMISFYKSDAEKPGYVNAWLFNAAQMQGIPDLFLALADRNAGQPLSAMERAHRIVAGSKATITHGEGDHAVWYNPIADQIVIPDKSRFPSEANYYAALLHELAHYSAREGRLGLKLEGDVGSPNHIREELRTNIASLLIGAELNLSHDYGDHHDFFDSWLGLIKDKPAELFKAAADAQKMADYVLAFEQVREVKEEINQTVNIPDKLAKGDVVAYKGKEYKVTAELKNNVLQMEESTGRKFKLSAKDGLYASLVSARNNPQEQAETLETEQQQDEETGLAEQQEQAEEQSHSYGRKR
jgi:antirestriction protein ArdC